MDEPDWMDDLDPSDLEEPVSCNGCGYEVELQSIERCHRCGEYVCRQCVIDVHCEKLGF